MRRISAANTAPGNLFRDANPGTGQKATSFNAAWCNDVQESLLFPIELAGRTPGADANQLFRSLVDLIYRVGDYKSSEHEESPAVVFTWQTWVPVPGRVLIGFDDSQTEFNLLGKQGGSKDVVVPRDGWGAETSGGRLAEPSVSGRLVTGSGDSEDREDLESLAQASADRTIAGAALPPHRVTYHWRRTA